MGSKKLNPHPIQDKESGIIGNKMDVLFSHLRRPANEFIPAADMPGSGRESKTGNRSFMGKDNIFKMFANRPCISQVMIVFNKAVEEFFFRSTTNLFKLEWLNV